ncbi:DM13 domain-containing protein [Actinoplanes sp. NPDC049668]|uniref:DM13 domain-containing protein n=1 Tax=unclassified Actinoplanes TaxID=2626549 RepID=UPI0033B5B8B7
MFKYLVATRARRRVAWLVLAAGVAVAAVALPLFQPWKIWVDETVDEPPPAAVAAVSGTASAGPRATAGPATIARGTFVSHEHDTTGTVRVVRGPDGSRHLRIEDLDTSNGPALKVWLTDAPVLAGRDGWHVFDDGRHVDLGALKGNKGSQNYPIPAGVDLAAYRSVSIWCARFRVSFGAAQLTD